MASSGELVLVTGSTGYLGFAVLVQTLKAGYRVRAAVRSVEDAKKKLLTTTSLSDSALAKNLSFVEVPDIVAKGAYQEAIKDVHYIIHVASPLPSAEAKDFEKEIIQPAKLGTLGVLDAALQEPSVKRIVITSSAVANLNLASSDQVNTHTRIPVPKGPYADVGAAYRASKTAALQASEDFVRDNKPSWDLISILPSYIIGFNELAHTTDQLSTGTASYPIRSYVSDTVYPPTFITAVDVQDVAFLHVASLNKNIKGNRSYGATQRVDWNDAWAVIAEKFPEAVEEGIFKHRDIKLGIVDWDASESEQAFNFKYRPFAQSVIDAAKQWLELRK